MVDVKKGHLPCAFLQDHDERITEVENLRKVEDPQNTSEPNLIWIVFERIATMSESVCDVRLIENFDDHPGGERGQDNVVNELKGFRREGGETFHGQVSDIDHDEIGEGDQKGVERIHQREISRECAAL